MHFWTTRRLSLALFFLALGAAGCGGNNSPSYTPGPNPPGGGPTMTPTGAPTITPSGMPTASAIPNPAASATVLFAADAQAGVAEYNAQTGAAIQTIGASSSGSAYQVGVDDQGNAYVLYESGSSSSSSSATSTFEKISPTGAVLATYQPTSPTGSAQSIGVAPTGEFVVSGIAGGGGSQLYDEWDPGSTSATPNRTIATSVEGDGDVDFALDAAGNLYAPVLTMNSTQFAVYAADSSTQTSTITDTVAPNESDYLPESMAVGPNGTLYVGEGSFSNDPDQGVYAYPTSGAQAFSTQAGTVVGVDTDALGNVYAAINNATSNTGDTGTFGSDTAHSVATFTSTLTPVASFNDNLPGVIAATAGQNGAFYLSEYGNGIFADGPTGAGNIGYVAPAGTSASVLIAGINTLSISLLYGTTAHNSYPLASPRKPFYASVGTGIAHGAAGRFFRAGSRASAAMTVRSSGGHHPAAI